MQTIIGYWHKSAAWSAREARDGKALGFKTNGIDSDWTGW